MPWQRGILVLTWSATRSHCCVVLVRGPQALADRVGKLYRSGL